MLTVDVKVHAIRYRADRAKPHQVRWNVGGKLHGKSFTTKTQADGRRAQLISACQRGELFDVESGLPKPEFDALTAPPQVTWFEHAKDYAEMKWQAAASAKGRATRADALAAVTASLVKDTAGAPPPAVLRRALTGYAFNFSEHRPPVPEALSSALEWVAKKAVPMPDLEADPEVIRLALTGLSTRLDGKKTAASTITNRRTVLNNALRYAVSRRRLAENPLPSVDWTPPPTDDEIDWRYVPNPEQAAALIDAVGKVGPRGEHLQAFFAGIYHVAHRPAEGMHLKEDDCHLPEKGWGQLVFAGSASRVGSAWTDDGQSFEERALKKRARSATREVPAPQVYVRMLQAHIDRYGVAPDGRLYRASEGGILLSKEYTGVWKEARKIALPRKMANSPFADVPYALRKAGISFWLRCGMDPTEAAARAGHSVAVLYKFYARVLDGRREQANALIDRAMQEAEDG